MAIAADLLEHDPGLLGLLFALLVALPVALATAACIRFPGAAAAAAGAGGAADTGGAGLPGPGGRAAPTYTSWLLGVVVVQQVFGGSVGCPRPHRS